MDCLSVDELAAMAAEGARPGDDDALHHLRACADCSRRLSDLKRQQDSIAELLAAWPPQPGPDCPEWELLAASVEHGPLPDASIEAHLENCAYCMLQVARFRAAQESARAPLAVLAAAPATRTEGRSWFSGPGRRGWSVALVGTVAALCILGVSLNRKPKYDTIALSRPPVGLPPASASGPIPTPAPPTGEHQAPGATQQLPLAAEPAPLYRGLPGAGTSVRVFLRSTAAQGPVEASIPLAEPLFLHSGDLFSLRVTGASKMWLYAFEEDSQGTVSALFPNAGFRTGANPVASDDRALPSAGNSYPLDNTAGLERIYIFYGPARLDRCERLLGLTPSGGSTDPQIGKILREMVKVAGSSPRSALHYEAMRFSFQYLP
jgi:hypothetical protein